MKKKAMLISCFDWYEKRLKPIKELLEKEYDVVILTSDFSHIEKKEVLIKHDGCTYIHVPPYRKNLSIERIFSHFTFAKSVDGYLEKIKPDLIYLLMPPNSTAKYCLGYKKKNPGTTYIVDVIDLWPESMPLGFLKNTFPFHLWAGMRNNSVAKADYVFTECALYQETLKSFADKIETLYLFKEQTKSAALEVQECIQKRREKKENSKTLILGYLGSMNHIIDIENICSIIGTLKEDGYMIQLRVVGDGENREKFLEQLKATKAEVHYYGKVYDEFEKSQILGLCDYCFNMMKREVSVGLTIKSIDYLSMGIPIINNIAGDTWNLVEDENIGINFDGDVSKIIQKIKEENSVEKGINARNCFETHFTLQAFKDKLARTLRV